MPRGGKRMPSYRDIAETMDGDELDAILDVSLPERKQNPNGRRKAAPSA